jgi:hypothetical protein
VLLLPQALDVATCMLLHDWLMGAESRRCYCAAAFRDLQVQAPSIHAEGLQNKSAVHLPINLLRAVCNTCCCSVGAVLRAVSIVGTCVCMLVYKVVRQEHQCVCGTYVAAMLCLHTQQITSIHTGLEWPHAISTLGLFCGKHACVAAAQCRFKGES